VRRILDLWASGGNSDTGRDEVHAWSVGYVSSTIEKEARAITKDGWLQTLRRPINAGFVLGFNMSNIHDRLQESAGVAMRMFEAFAAGQRVAKLTLKRIAKKQTVGGPQNLIKLKLTYHLQIVTSVATQLLGEHSHGNNFVKRILSLYMYVSGAQHQAITVISHLGITESYNNLIAKAGKPQLPKSANATEAEGISPPSTTTQTPGSPTSSSNDPSSGPPLLPKLPEATAATTGKKKPRRPTIPRQPGTLRKLSASMRDMARVVASMGLYATAYDNINMMFRAAEQIIGRSGR